MPIPLGNANAFKLNQFQIRADDDGSGWRVGVDLEIGVWNPATNTFTRKDHRFLETDGANVPGLTNPEKQTLAALFVKIISAIPIEGHTLTSPTRTGYVWHE